MKHLKTFLFSASVLVLALLVLPSIAEEVEQPMVSSAEVISDEIPEETLASTEPDPLEQTSVQDVIEVESTVEEKAVATPVGKTEFTAKAALKILAHRRGVDLLARVVMIEGRFGTHQPKAWRILVADQQAQGRIREFMVTAGRVASERTMLAWKISRIVPLREVMLDSSDAFIRADLSAKDAKVGFDRLDYQLLLPPEAKEPVWVVSLLNQAGTVAGEIQLGARTGVVDRKAWPQLQTQVTPPAEPGHSASRPVAAQPKAGVRRPSAPVFEDVPTPAPAPMRKKTLAKKAVTRQPAKREPVAKRAPVQQRRPLLAAENSNLKDAPGQILEGARQGIIRTSGNLKDFLKGALKERQ